MDFLRFLEGIRTPFFDQVFQYITYFGQELILIAVICALYWCADKRFAYVLGLTYFTAGLCVQTLKITFRIPRPWILDPTFTPVESAVEGATGYSFPSGHTQGGTCLFAPLAFRAEKKWLKRLCVLAFLSIGFSRMYLGVHTPKDVCVSMGLSLLIAYGITRFSSVLLDETAHTVKITAVLIGSALFVAGYAAYLHGAGLIETPYATDCMKAAGAGIGFGVGFYLERTKIHYDTYEQTNARQGVKFLVGFLLVILVKTGTKQLLPATLLGGAVNYFLTVFCVLVICPLVFRKMRIFYLQ